MVILTLLANLKLISALYIKETFLVLVDKLETLKTVKR